MNLLSMILVLFGHVQTTPEVAPVVGPDKPTCVVDYAPDCEKRKGKKSKKRRSKKSRDKKKSAPSSRSSRSKSDKFNPREMLQKLPERARKRIIARLKELPERERMAELKRILNRIAQDYTDRQKHSDRRKGYEHRDRDRGHDRARREHDRKSKNECGRKGCSGCDRCHRSSRKSKEKGWSHGNEPEWHRKKRKSKGYKGGARERDGRDVARRRILNRIEELMSEVYELKKMLAELDRKSGRGHGDWDWSEKDHYKKGRDDWDWSGKKEYYYKNYKKGNDGWHQEKKTIRTGDITRLRRKSADTVHRPLSTAWIVLRKRCPARHSDWSYTRVAKIGTKRKCEPFV